MSETTLAVRPPETSAAIAAYGNRYDLDALANRFLAFYDVGDEAAAATNAALKAAQYTIRFGMTPGVHVHIVKRGGKWGAELTYEAWKAFAERHAFLGSFRYMVQTRAMTPEEVKAHTSGNIVYHQNDRGYFARAFRFDIAKECKEYGIPYEPEWQVGFWRQNAYQKKEWRNGANGQKGRYVDVPGQFDPDTIPNQRTPEWVAEKRASRAALTMAFTMIELDDFEKRYGSVERALQNRALLASTHMDAELNERTRKEHEHDGLAGATFVDAPAYEMDDNGDIWATEQPRARKQPSVTLAEAPTMAAGQPAHADGWGDWVTEPDILTAYQWGANSGKFKGGAHAQAAWKKVQDQYAGKPVSEFLAAWRDYVNGHDDKPQKEVQQEKANVPPASTPAATGVEGSDTQEARTSAAAPGGQSPAVSLPWQDWQKVDDLFGWAVEAGHYETLDQARVSFANMLSFKGLRYTKPTMGKVHEAWFEFHQQNADGYVDAEAIEDGEWEDGEWEYSEIPVA